MLRRTNASSSESEEEIWIEAACQVLAGATRPLHYTEIKREILQRGLVAPGLATTLDSALNNDSCLPKPRVRQVPGKPGYFYSKEMHSPTRKSAGQTKQNKNSNSLKSPTRRPTNKQKTVKRGNSAKQKNVKPGDTQTIPKEATETDIKIEDVKDIKVSLGNPNVTISEDNHDHKNGPTAALTQGNGTTNDIEQKTQPIATKPNKLKNTKLSHGSSKKRNREKGPNASLKRPGPSQQTPLSKYEERYKRLKRLAKDLIFINAAYCDEVVHTEAEIMKAKEQRKYLLTRLLHRKTSAEAQQAALASTPGESSTSRLSLASHTKQTPQSIAQILGNVEKRNKRKASPSAAATVTKAASLGVGGTAGVAKSAKQASQNLESGKGKGRAKSRSTAAKAATLSNPQPADSSVDSNRLQSGVEEQSSSLLPLTLGHLTVQDLGEVVSDRPGYHTIKHLYPVGFQSVRRYHALTPQRHSCLYTCKILDNGSAPLFEIHPEGERLMRFRGNTATESHNKLLLAINQSRGRDFVALGDKGPAFFGFTHPAVQQLIQSQTQVQKCAKYKVKKVSKLGELFIETDPAVNMDLSLHTETDNPTAAPGDDLCKPSNLLAIQGSIPFATAAATLNPGAPGLLIPLLPNG